MFLNHINYICKIVSDAYQNLPTIISPGNTEREVTRKLKIDMSKRPQNLGPEKYFEICKELENLYN